MNKEKLLKYENMKLKNQLIFTLPATKEVCGRVCKGCYAINPQVRFPNTVPQYRDRMYKRSMSIDFMSDIDKEIRDCAKEVKAVRVHEAGEFYSQVYITRWFIIAKMNPETKFYAFTKRLKEFDFTELMALPNFVVIDSMKFNGFNYGTLEEMQKLEAKGAKLCPATLKGASKDTCGVSCSYCWSKGAQEKGVVFVKH